MEIYEYELTWKVDGTKLLRRYNSKYGFWINLEFSPDSEDSMGSIIETLKNTYIRTDWSSE